MSSMEHLRKFVNERLTAAAEEIFGVFRQTIVEYEEELDRQRRLLDDAWRSDIKILNIAEEPEAETSMQHSGEVLSTTTKTELPQQHVCKEEEDLSDQERSSSLDQEEPEPPQIKEEEEDCSSQEGEQVVLKQETETFMVTPVCEEDEDQTLDWNPDEESVVDMSVLNSVESEENRDLQLLSNNSHVAESQDQEGGDHEDSGSGGDEEGELNKTKQSKRKSHTYNLYNPAVLRTYWNTQTRKKSFQCDTCGKDFKFMSDYKRHLRIHTGEKPHICKICGKEFSQSNNLTAHMRIHTGEKPFPCLTCGRAFRHRVDMTSHMRSFHTGEKPYICKICGKDFSRSSNLAVHMRIHTGEKPHICRTCGKAFTTSSSLSVHVRRVHTDATGHAVK